MEWELTVTDCKRRVNTSDSSAFASNVRVDIAKIGADVGFEMVRNDPVTQPDMNRPFLTNQRNELLTFPSSLPN